MLILQCSEVERIQTTLELLQEAPAQHLIANMKLHIFSTEKISKTYLLKNLLS